LSGGGIVATTEDVLTYILTLSGLQVMAIPAVVAMRGRGMKGAARAMASMPAYFGLVCLASWVALFDLALRPFHWAKTEHGRARGGVPETAAAAKSGPAAARLAIDTVRRLSSVRAP